MNQASEVPGWDLRSAAQRLSPLTRRIAIDRASLYGRADPQGVQPRGLVDLWRAIANDLQAGGAGVADHVAAIGPRAAEVELFRIASTFYEFIGVLGAPLTPIFVHEYLTALLGALGRASHQKGSQQ